MNEGASRKDSPRLEILGIRSLPPAHGGFETFVGRLAPHLATLGLDVDVFCQAEGGREVSAPTSWRGVALQHLPAKNSALGSVWFDLQGHLRVALARGPRIALVFGYNTAVFSVALRLVGVPVVINMDGVEWQRRKWGRVAKAWFYVNEALARRFASRLIADHPEIASGLKARGCRAPITVIPYGADSVVQSDASPVSARGLTPGRYALIIARPEPENSILEMVRAFSSEARGIDLVVLGAYSEDSPYQAKVLAAASDEVKFIGPIYDTAQVAALRFHSAFYLYGHTVGGTSPTLVEALGAGSACVCLDGPYSRWVAGEAGIYFADEAHARALLTPLCAEARGDAPPGQLAAARGRARDRHAADFTWETVFDSYRRTIQESAG